MAGSLFHGRDFVKNAYLGSDGQEHYELTPIDGDIEVVSVSTWLDVETACEREGIERSLWPAFEDAIDVPLDVVRLKNARLRPLLADLGKRNSVHHEVLASLVQWSAEGQLFFFCQ